MVQIHLIIIETAKWFQVDTMPGYAKYWVCPLLL